MNYRPTTFPGALVTGFAENIAYIREIYVAASDGSG